MQENSTDTPKASFDRAATFLRGGDPELAERICRQALNAFPRDANLLCLLGAALIKQEKARDAEHTLTRAVQLFNDFSRAHEGLAEALILQGKLAEALESLDRADRLEPGSASIKMKQAKVLTALGRDDEATRYFEESFKLTPHREDLVRGLGLQRMGNLREAEKIYREVLVKSPDDVDALRLLAGIAMRAKQWGDAIVLLEKVLDIAPDYYRGWMDIGLAHHEMENTEKAISAYAQATRLDPGKSQSSTAAGKAYAMIGQHDDAIRLFRQALEKNASDADALAGMGHVLKTVGHQDEAIASYRECIRHNPNHGEAYWSLANLKTFQFDADEVAEMESLVEREGLDEEARANFQFALGKAYEDSGNYERAFEFYDKGNENRRARENYDPVETIDSHDKFIEAFNASLFAERTGVGCDSNAPIFIIGLPRSGSTLIEQILASHPDVEGTHELPELARVGRSIGLRREDRQSYPLAIRGVETDEFRELGEDYLRRTERHRDLKLPRFTDKMPNNFVHVGLISLILPNAKIIDARRHPLDSCLGSFKQLFARGASNTYSLFEIGEFYLEYVRMMNHWDNVLPGKVLRVQYEDIVADLDTQVRRILDHCDLPFNEACLRFYETDRAVKTASSEQVRKPIYTSSVHLWRRYEAQLDPLVEVLEPVLRELPEGWWPESLSK
ncbi:MAG: tetratricopeptide repeat protein [Gammaproteobacteria bacterium]|nr:tetratricopeptide repeat protein [Gammaproteobacteria bacterium]